MSKTEMRELAKDENFSDEEREQISAYINQYGEAMGKAIHRNYYTM